jgi:hypothetical protein
LPAARSDDRLPLLPSGSDGVHGPFLHRTRSSTPPRACRIRDAGPREGIQPRWSGLRVQGTASSPPSTTMTMVSRDAIQGSSLVLVFGSDVTGVDGEVTGDEPLVARGTTTATGFPCASIAMRAQPSPAGLLNGRARNARSGNWPGNPLLSPGMSQIAVVSTTPHSQSTRPARSRTRWCLLARDRPREGSCSDCVAHYEGSTASWTNE